MTLIALDLVADVATQKRDFYELVVHFTVYIFILLEFARLQIRSDRLKVVLSTLCMLLVVILYIISAVQVNAYADEFSIYAGKVTADLFVVIVMCLHQLSRIYELKDKREKGE